LRVISGLKKGHKLKAPKSIDVRPTEDRIKESLFNILNHIDGESIILDGFAGSGSIGIEFLSRGAKLCYFIDSSPDSIASVKENLNHTKLVEQSIVLKSDTIFAIKSLGQKNITFDYIYLDPPFRQPDLIDKLLREIALNKILDNKGMIIIEHEKELKLEEKLYEYEQIDYRKYGSKSLSFYKKSLD
jgi:16S rRNA (guanine(966)-N(2))-methyltransferase RsmD